MVRVTLNGNKMLNIEVGKTYLTNEGETVKIVEYKKVDENDGLPFYGDNDFWYSSEGTVYQFGHAANLEPFNLVKEIA